MRSGLLELHFHPFPWIRGLETRSDPIIPKLREWKDCGLTYEHVVQT